MSSTSPITFIIDINEIGMRLDTVIPLHFTEISRSQALTLIRRAAVCVDGVSQKAGYKVKAGESVSVVLPPAEPIAAQPEAIDLEIIFEDAALLVINKPAGLVVHPGPGHGGGTLVNALLHHCPDLAGIGGGLRPGIVHRLDKDTSGLIIVAKNDQAHQNLARQFKERRIEKIYQALVYGMPAAERGFVDLPIGRHAVDRKRMSVNAPRGRSALTLWRVVERFASESLLELELKTGRTHQIRVHCQAIGHPIIGDAVYAAARARRSLQEGAAPTRHPAAGNRQRQMLHAMRLAFQHPVTGARLRFEAPLPSDMQMMTAALRQRALAATASD